MSSADGAAPGASTYVTLSVNLRGTCPGSTCECLPQTLPVDASGDVPCQMLFELAAADSCAAHGLTAATADVVASLATQGASSPGPVCVLPELSRSAWVDGSCATSTQPGWCYVTGAAAGGCAQTIATSASGAPPSGAISVLGCDESTPGASQSQSASGVGKTCVPAIEGSEAFAGFDFQEVSLEDGNAACGGDACLVNHFQGLTSCPYGQSSSGDAPSGASPCTVPDSGAPVQPDAGANGETVQPWCADRTASDTVYCSCRCANTEGQTDDGASYCACPGGFTCTQVVSPVEANDPRAGAYCIKSGTAYSPDSVCSATCSPTTHPCP